MTEKGLLVENINCLRGIDLFLGMVCILFFLDTAIPVASMGPVAISLLAGEFLINRSVKPSIENQ